MIIIIIIKLPLFIIRDTLLILFFFCRLVTVGSLLSADQHMFTKPTKHIESIFVDCCMTVTIAVVV